MLEGQVGTSREGELLAGKYLLEKRLGAGGMGEVYRATNAGIGRTVAIKLLRTEHLANRNVIARFLTEARAANVVRHPNVVDVLDIDQAADGTPFIVQELLEGKDLATHLHDYGGRIPPELVLKIVVPIADALAAAHAAGVVHRDLKPENVFLARTGKKVTPKLLDFGISQMREGSSRITSTGAAMGTPAYMSPEQIQDAKLVDARTDVWAFGVMLYELLSGQLPFTAESPGAVFVMIVTAEPRPLEEIATGVPPALARVVARCMRKKREERYASAAALANDLRSITSGHAVDLPVSSGSAARDPVAHAATISAGDMRPRGPSRGDGGMVELEGEARGHSGLHVATLRPPRPVVARGRSDRPSAAGIDPDVLVGAIVLGLVVTAVGGAITVANPIPSGISLHALAGRYLDDVPHVAAAAVGGVVALVAIYVGVTGVRMAPASWGHVVAAAGLLVMGAIAVSVGLSGEQTAHGLVTTALPIAAALVPLGLGVYGLRLAWTAWHASAGGKASAVVIAVIVGAAFFLALQLARGSMTAAASPRTGGSEPETGRLMRRSV